MANRLMARVEAHSENGRAQRDVQLFATTQNALKVWSKWIRERVEMSGGERERTLKRKLPIRLRHQFVFALIC